MWKLIEASKNLLKIRDGPGMEQFPGGLRHVETQRKRLKCPAAVPHKSGHSS